MERCGQLGVVVEAARVGFSLRKLGNSFPWGGAHS